VSVGFSAHWVLQLGPDFLQLFMAETGGTAGARQRRMLTETNSRSARGTNRPACEACSVGPAMRQAATSLAWIERLLLVRSSPRARLAFPAEAGTVQQRSTATYRDSGGLAGTRRDGDLRGWTWVDVLPSDGMQEVRSSNLLSSTGQKHNSNESNSEYSSKVQQRRPDGPPLVCSDRASSPGSGCWHGSGLQALNRRWTVPSPGQTPTSSLL
jgi:hypothetical protein